MRYLDTLSHVAMVVLSLALGACASYDPRLNSRNTVYLGTGGPVIDRVFPLTEALEAQRYMTTNAQIGKIVLRA